MIIIIYSLCPIFTKPPDWRKALSKGVKTHLFKLKISKISQGWQEYISLEYDLSYCETNALDIARTEEQASYVLELG